MTYREYMRGSELILSVAPTGYREREERTEYVPATPEEIATAVAESRAGGATIAHLHGRREDGSPSVSRLPVVAEAIREQADEEILIEYAASPGDQLGDYLDVMDQSPRPDIAQVRVGPGQFGRRGVTDISRRDTDRMVEEIVARDIKPNLVVESSRDLHEVSRLRQSDILETKPLITLKFGAKSGTVATPQLLFSLLDAAPSDANVIVSATGPNQYPLTTMAIFYDAHVRVGMEDNLYLDQDTPVTQNRQLIDRVSHVVEQSQRELASVDRAKELLTLTERARDLQV